MPGPAYEERVELATLVPMPGNPRRNEPAIRPVAESIKRFGWTNPILARASDRVVVAGHTRLEAAKALGLKQVPVIWLDLNERDSRLYNLADNKLAQLAEWDAGPLAEMLRELQAEDAAGLLVAGFGEDEIAALLAETAAGAGGVAREEAGRTLAERFLVPPFSVLDARQGYCAPNTGWPVLPQGAQAGEDPPKCPRLLEGRPGGHRRCHGGAGDTRRSVRACCAGGGLEMRRVALAEGRNAGIDQRGGVLAHAPVKPGAEQRAGGRKDGAPLRAQAGEAGGKLEGGGPSAGAHHSDQAVYLLRRHVDMINATAKMSEPARGTRRDTMGPG